MHDQHLDDALLDDGVTDDEAYEAADDEEEVTFTEDLGDADDEFGDADAYYRAFAAVFREGVHENHLALLRAHYASPDHTATWEELAKAVGYARGAAVNMQYGSFAKRVANAMGIDEAPRDFWLFVLVNWAGRDPHSGHTTFFLRAPVIAALQRLAILPQSSGASLMDAETALRRLLPSEFRSDVLDAIATSIELAHWANPTGWACTLDGGALALTVGRYEALRVDASEPAVRLVVASEAVPEEAHAQADVAFAGGAEGYFASAPGSKLCGMPHRRVGRAYAMLLPAHTAFVAEYGRGELGRTFRTLTTPGAVDRVAQELGRPLPQPDYVSG